MGDAFKMQLMMGKWIFIFLMPLIFMLVEQMASELWLGLPS